MERFDHKKAPRQELTTSGGVQVVVRDPEPEEVEAYEPYEPYEPPPPSDPGPMAVVFPPGQNLAERAAFMAELERDWGRLIDLKLRRSDVSVESAEDLHQDALVLLSNERHRLTGTEEQVTEFVATVVTHMICNRSRHAERAVVRGVDLDAQIAAAPDPEDRARKAELWRKLMGYVDELSPVEREVWKAKELDGKTLEEIAAALGQPLGTVGDRYARAVRKLEDRARASERAVDLRAPRPQQSTGARK